MPSTLRRRFAAVRAELLARGVTAVELVSAARELDAVQQQLVELAAVQVDRWLTTGECEASPGVEKVTIVSIGVGLRQKYRPEQLRDLAALKSYLAEWWLGLSGALGADLQQYGLAPLIVRESGCEWSVGVFAPGFNFGALAVRRGLVVAKDFGDGTVLFRKGA